MVLKIYPQSNFKRRPVNMAPKNILQLSKEEKQQFIKSFDLVLNDCDGVVWTLTGGLPGINEGIECLYNLNKKIAFVSNNSLTNQEKYEHKFKALGVNFDYDTQLIHPAASFVSYLNKIKFDKSQAVFVVGGPVHTRFLEENGYKSIIAKNTYDAKDFSQFYKDIMAEIKDQKVGAVCFDGDINFNMAKFYIAEYILNKNPECLLLIGATDPEFYIYDYSFVGSGIWAQNLVDRCPQKPIFLGKPGNALGEIMMDKYEIKDKSRVLFVGDTLKQDIGFGKSNGFQTLLVLSGVTSREMLDQHEKQHEIPDYVADSLFDFVQVYNDLQKSDL